ncbi:hypothetical protein [Kaistella sp.]|uniref:hypothetical protein n=1 Tax=Kaistella sp. TaxID=2782235 RepID=UPI0035A12D63
MTDENRTTTANSGSRCTTLQFYSYSKKQDENRPLLKRFKGGLFFNEEYIFVY